MSLQGTLNFGHGSDDSLYFGQNRFLTPIQIDIKIKMNWRKLWQTKSLQNRRCITEYCTFLGRI